MILSVPYAFNVHGYEGLRRTHSTFRKAGTVDIKVEEISAETAVLAAEIGIESSERGRRDRIFVPYRHVEGAGLYVPFNMQSLHGVPDTPSSVADFAGIVAEGELGFLNPFKKHADGASNANDGAAKFNPKKRIWDDREEVEASIHEIASQLIVVDGTVFIRLEPGEEPVIVANPRNISEWHRGDRAFDWVKVTEAKFLDDPSVTYRLDEWEVARERVMASGYGNETIASARDLPFVKMHEPSGFVWETEATSLANSLYHLFDKLKEFVNSRAEDRTPNPDLFRTNDGWRSKRVRQPVPKEAALALAEMSTLLACDLDHAKLASCRPLLEAIAKVDWKESDSYDHATRYVAEALDQALADLDRYQERPARLRHENLDEDDLVALQGRI